MWDTQWYVFIICKIHVEKGNRVHKIKNYKSFLYTFRAMWDFLLPTAINIKLQK